jgi:hypothetical protein
LRFLNNIKRKIARSQVRKEFRNLRRTGKVINLSNAQSVGLIYQVTNQEKFEIIKKYVKHLREEEGIRKIMALGYVDDKILPEFVSPKLDIDFFSNKDVSWNFKPTGTSVRNFINEHWDILIDLEAEEIIPLRYILNLSKARLKVGYRHPESENYYDLMIDVKSPNLVDFIAQTNYYLSIINQVS